VPLNTALLITLFTINWVNAIVFTVFVTLCAISCIFWYYQSCILTELKYINCNIFPYSYFPHVLSLHILYIQLQTVKCINCIINCKIFPYSYFPHVLSLHILYTQLQTVKCINCIINCNIVLYSYFPHVLSLHILYIQLQTVKCINCIINCNIFPYSYFPHILSLHNLYIRLQTLKCIWTLSITKSTLLSKYNAQYSGFKYVCATGCLSCNFSSSFISNRGFNST